MLSTPDEASSALVRRLLHYARPRQLQLVARMAEFGTIQKAALALGMSQPSATQALTRLEELLGIALFDRHARGVRPTREGGLLMPAVQRALASLEELARDAENVGRGANGLVRIAGIAAASTAIAAEALPTLCRAHPELWIEYREIDAAQIPALCHEQAADLLLCRSASAVTDGYVFVPLSPDRLGVYCAADHPLAARRALSLRACAQATWLRPPEDSPPHRAFMQWCEQLPAAPKLVRVQTRSLPVSVALVRHLQLLYVGLESHLAPYVASGQLRRLPLMVPGSPDALGMLRRQEATPGVELAARHLMSWARHQ